MFQNSPKVTIHLGNFCYKKFHPELKNCRIWSHCNASNFCCVSFFVFRAKKYERGTHNVFFAEGTSSPGKGRGGKRARALIFSSWLAQSNHLCALLSYQSQWTGSSLSLSLSLSSAPSLSRAVKSFILKSQSFFRSKTFWCRNSGNLRQKRRTLQMTTKEWKSIFHQNWRNILFCVETFLILLTIVNFFSLWGHV